MIISSGETYPDYDILPVNYYKIGAEDIVISIAPKLLEQLRKIQSLNDALQEFIEKKIEKRCS